MKARCLVAALLLALPANAQPTADELVKRCEAVPWKVPLGWSSTVPPRLAEIRRELVRAGRPVLAVLKAALPNSLHLRRIAAPVAATWPCDDARAILLALLDDPDGQVARSAAFHLGEVGGREVVGPLLAAGRSRRGSVRHDVLNALGSLGAPPGSAEVALDALTSGVASVRHSAAELLAQLGEPVHAAAVVVALRRLVARERDAGVKQAAERTLRILRARRD